MTADRRTRPGKIVCVGRNYRAHAAELGNEVPREPLLFLKPPSSIINDGDPIILPSISNHVEHEGEIGIVIGARLKDATEDESRAAVAAVIALNDVTARDLQRSDGQWTRAKGFDTFCPVGAPVDPPSDLSTITVTTHVNGALRQSGRASEMVFPIPFLLSYISRIMTLEPGDYVATGTPSGVGALVPGDVVEVEVGGSVVRNTVRERVESSKQ
ncbi:MAG TPA: fumarylacetoacetate hydrolase family protein [Gemmatimonadaceae bacterium]|jgi:2-keto-4-pentenoate hydratase/2-oxohepta-3-ene-1,7-dioic acid hydratase (catechol pathway)